MTMSLQQLAMDAIMESSLCETVDATDEAVETGAQEIPECVSSVDNGDGTSTLSISFTLDPAVVAEKAKAMAKGVKREDMTDDLGESDNGDAPYADDVDDEESVKDSAPQLPLGNDETSHSPYDDDEKRNDGENEEEEGENGSTEAPKDLFSDTLDSIEGEAMDARKASRHSQTPIENCRAKDPRFCPYHGQVAWQAAIDKALQDGGIQGASAKVEFDSASGRYTMSVTVPNAQAGAVGQILSTMSQEKGVDQGNPDKNGRPRDWAKPKRESTPGAEILNFRTNIDKQGRLNEMVDDFTMDTPIEDMDMDEYSILMEQMDDVDTAKEAIDDKLKNNQTVTDQEWDDYNKKLLDAEMQYHKTKAQYEWKELGKPKDVEDKANDIDKTAQKAANDYGSMLKESEDAKAAFFPGGRFPPKSGLSKEPWAEEYQKLKRKIGDTAAEKVKECKSEIDKELQNKTPDMKMLRLMIGAYDYAVESYENNFPRFKKAQKKFMQGLHDWASNISHPALQTAFPNGRP